MGDRTFGCYTWNEFRSTDGALNLSRALAVSCNYYFYCIATNKDWNNGASLGLDGMGMDKMLEVASEPVSYTHLK